MAIITFEKNVELNEINLVQSVIESLESNTYIDVRDFRSELEILMEAQALRTFFIIGSGSSHIWMKRVGESMHTDRWAIITN
ncbi:hypothetical protein Dfri01_58920 [Dyadobacter frigoris]|nr:hypothetical protein Dfri01_58920 [Dyadobacter frigoris]